MKSLFDVIRRSAKDISPHEALHFTEKVLDPLINVWENTEPRYSEVPGVFH